MVRLWSRRMIRRIRSLRRVRNRLVEQQERRNFTDDEDDIIDLTQFPELFDEEQAPLSPSSSSVQFASSLVHRLIGDGHWVPELSIISLISAVTTNSYFAAFLVISALTPFVLSEFFTSNAGGGRHINPLHTYLLCMLLGTL